MHMTYDDVRALPQEVYEVLVDELVTEQNDAERDAEGLD
jgi:hypothetical protein